MGWFELVPVDFVHARVGIEVFPSMRYPLGEELGAEGDAVPAFQVERVLL